MAQAGRKTYLIQSVGMPAALRHAVREAVAQQNANTRDVPLNVSQWIVRAIRRDLNHRERSRRRRGNPVPAAL